MAVVLLLAVACTFPDVQILEAPAAPTECALPTDCPSSGDACRQATCRQGHCDFDPLPAGTSCGAGRLCDGQARCVDCIGADDCASPEVCQDGSCVSPHCTNGQLDPAETDVDCGAECAPCPVGQGCIEASDCATNLCVAEVCASCGEDADCAAVAGTYCQVSAGACLDRKQDGVECSRDGECQNGHCPAPDYVCCESACTGTCRACRAVATGVPTGECDYVKSGLDPDNDCPLTTACNGSGLCL